MFFWELFHFRNERNIIPFILQQNERNERNAVYSEYAEYAFTWEILAGNPTRSPGFRLEDVIVLRSPPP